MIEIECGSDEMVEIEARDDRVVCEREFEAKDDRVMRERAPVPRLKYHHARDRQWPTTCPSSSHDSGTHADRTSDDRDVKNCEDQNLGVNVEDILCAEDDQLEDSIHVSFENGAPAEWADDKRDNYSIINVNASGHDAIYGNHEVSVRSHDITDGSHNDDVIDGIHDTAGRSHNDYVIAAGNHDETNRSHDAIDKSHDDTNRSHDDTNTSHDTTDKSLDSTSVDHDITDVSHASKLDMDGHIRKLSSVPDNTCCVKERERILGESAEHILPPSTCTNKLPTPKHTTNVTDRNQGNIPRETDISKRREVSFSVATSSEGHIQSAVKTLGHVAAFRGIPSEVITTQCRHVDDTIAICHKEKRDLDHQVEVNNCLDTASGCMENVTDVVDKNTATRDNTLDLVSPGEGDTLVSEMISGSDGVYEQEARRDVDSSEPSCGDDGSVIQRTQQCVTTQDSSTCETKQNKPKPPKAVCCETQIGLETDDVVDVVNHGGGLSDMSAVTSDSGSHVNHDVRENPVLLERKGTTRTPDGATVQTNKHHSNSSGCDSVAPDASYLLSTPDTIDLSPSSGEDMTSPNFVASVQKQLLQMQVCQNLSAGADASDVCASPVNSDQPRIQPRGTSSESRDASSSVKPRHVTLRRKNKNPMDEGRRRRSLTAQGNRGVRPEHDTFKIQTNWMRRDVTDPPRSAQIRRSSLHSSIPVIVLTSDVNEVTYLSGKRRASHDAYC